MANKTLSFAGSDIGRIRSSNQDSGYAGYNLFFVADGMGGHAGGDIASALCAQRISRIDTNYSSAEDAARALVDVIWEANSLLGETAAAHPELAGMGTTFSGLIFAGEKVALGHIGDSRVYLTRDGETKQVTTDHTFVQRLVDTGRITPAEALVHPRRSVLMRVLGDVEEFPDVDNKVLDTKPGDRWLLCSDGLSGVVPPHIMQQILQSKVTAEEATELLIGEALEYGAPDNVTVVLVDVVDANLQTDFAPSAKFVGSSSNEVVITEQRGSRIMKILNPLTFADIFKRPEDPADYVPESDEYLEKVLRETRARIRWRRIRQLLSLLAIISLVWFGLVSAYDYTQSRYFVGVSNSHVTIFKGIKESLGPLQFSSVYNQTYILVSDLPQYQQDLVNRSITATDLKDAERIVELIKATVIK